MSLDESVEVKVGKIEVSMENLGKSFIEFKKDTKNFHTRQTEKLDAIAKDWNNISGSLKGMADIRQALNDLEAKVEKYNPMLDEIQDERLEDKKEIKRNIKEAKYMFYKIVAIAAVLVILGTNAKTLAEFIIGIL